MVTPGARLLAVRRSAVDAGSVAAVLLTVLAVCTLVSGVVASLPALQQQSLDASLRLVPADQLAVEVVGAYDAERAADQDAAVREVLAPLTDLAGGVVVRRLETVQHQEAGGGRQWRFLSLTGGSAAADPQAATGRLPEPALDGPVEVAVPAGADALDAGTELTLVSPLDGSRVPAVVTGSWRPPSQVSGATGPVGSSLLVAPDAFAPLAVRAASARWYAVPAVGRLRPEQVDSLRTRSAAVEREVAAAQERLGTSLRVENPLTAVVESRARELVAQRMLLLVPALMLLLLGAAATMLVAAALSETRRGDEDLLRSRGADRAQLVGPTALEALVLCAAGALAGPLLAAGVVRIGDVEPRLDSPAWVAALVAAGVCGVALLVPSVARALGGDRGEQLSIERRRRRALTALLALVLVMLALGGAAVVRLNGFSATVADRWDAGVDPLLVAAPSLLMLASVTVLALVLLPVLFRLAAWAVRTRGVVLALGTRSASRAPAKAVPLALAVALVAGGISFATVQRASQDAAREVRAAYDVGADVRVTAPPASRRPGAAQEREQLSALPGVVDVSAVHRELDFVDDVAAEVLVADLEGEVGRAMVSAAEDPPGVLAALAPAGGPGAEDHGTVPVAVTDDLVTEAALEIGSRIELSVGETTATLDVVATVPSLPTIDHGRAGILVDAAALDATGAAAPRLPAEWWLATDDPGAVAEALGDRPDLAARVVTRQSALDRLAADAGTGGRALADVMGVTAVGALVVGGVLLSSVVVLRRRERDAQAAALRALGAAERDVTMTLATEYTLATGGGLLTGALAGLLTAAVALPATSLGAGGAPLMPAPQLHVPWLWTSGSLAVLLLLPLTVLLLLTWLGGRSGRRRYVDGGRS